MHRKPIVATLSMLCITSLFLTGCLCGLLDKVGPGVSASRPGSTPQTADEGAPPPFPAGPVIANRPLNEPRDIITGKVVTGTTKTLGSIKVGAEGGLFTLDEPGLPVTGMAINVPKGAYDRPVDFKMTYAPITSTTFKNINPLTPLITIDNGGGYAGKALTVKMPVKVPPGHFAMGFFYDESKGWLDGIPLTEYIPGSITLATRHFSSFFVSSVEESLLKGPIDTGFKADADAWQLKNFPSMVINGHCSAMTISAIWYYLEQPDGLNARLWGRYDGIQGKVTPNYQGDDVFAIKLVDYIQTDYEDRGFGPEGRFREQVNLTPETTLRLFAYSMLVTRAPQMAVIPRHAMVANKITGNVPGIVDPNYPGEQRQSKFDAGTLTYDNQPLYYMGVTALVEWGQVAARWEALKSGAIGNEVNRYPPYEMKTGDAATHTGNSMTREEMSSLVTLADGHQSSSQRIFIAVNETDSNDDMLKIQVADCYVNGVKVTDFIKPWLKGIPHQAVVVNLNPGRNLVGLELSGTNRDSKYDYASEGWTAFRYLNINYEPSGVRLEPSSVEGETGQKLSFKVVSPQMANNRRYQWNNGLVDWETVVPTTDIIWQQPGEYNVTVMVINPDANQSRRLVGTAVAKASIKAKGVNKLPLLQQTRKLGAGLLKADVTTVFTPTVPPGPAITRANKDMLLELPYFGQEVPITWSGASFSGSYQQDVRKHSVQGTVSPDGLKLLSLVYTFDQAHPESSYTIRVELAGILLEGHEGSSLRGALQGAAVSGGLKRLEYTNKSCNARQDSCSTVVWSNVTATAQSLLQVSFLK
jgi:hypothetical protein